MAHAIRPAREADLPRLPAIERAAGERFRGVGLASIADAEPTGIDFLRAVLRHGYLAVATDDSDRPVGFAEAGVLDRALHLYELSVEPDHGRKGLGTRLVEAVERRAAELGVGAVTLATFRDVAWNAPFYARLGYRPIPASDWSPALFLLHAREREGGLPVERRIFMRKELP